VGSKPCLTISGTPVAMARSSFRTMASSGMISTVPRRIASICSLRGGKARMRYRSRGTRPLASAAAFR